MRDTDNSRMCVSISHFVHIVGGLHVNKYSTTFARLFKAKCHQPTYIKEEKVMRKQSLWWLLFLGQISFLFALDNGLALTPPMGWLSWERFGCQVDCETYPDSCISEYLYLQQAKGLVEGGYLEAGYRYVDIDDCWSEKERQNGKIVPDRHRFPKGIRWLSDQMHSLGLFLGLYGDIGTLTCAGYPGYQDHFEIDAHTLAEDFRVDSIKVDGCYANTSQFAESYPDFGKALNKTGRSILYSCSWPAYLSPNYGEDPDVLNHGIKQHCNTWRNYYDIEDSWDSVQTIMKWWSRGKDAKTLAAGPGHWNDPDMLVVGNPGLSISEQRAQFAIWAILAAPLYISADLRTISDESRDILLNRDIIAVNQDLMGRQGWCVDCEGNLQVWIRELLPSNGKACSFGASDQWAIALMNVDSIYSTAEITFEPLRHLGHNWTSFSVHDLYTSDRMIADTKLTVKVDESSVKMYKVVRGDNNALVTY